MKAGDAPELVRAEQKRHAKEQLELVLLNAINSGDPIDVTPARTARRRPAKR